MTIPHEARLRAGARGHRRFLARSKPGPKNCPVASLQGHSRPWHSLRPIANYINWRLYEYRDAIEAFLARIKLDRRIAARHDKPATTFPGFVQLATVLYWLKHVV